MALMPSKVQIVKFSVNFVLPHSKTSPNTTSLVDIATFCVNWTLMGLATFVATHSNPTTALRVTNKCMALESKRHNTQLIFTLNLSKNNFGPNLVTLTFVMNPPCA